MPTNQDVENLCQSLTTLIEFAREKGKEYYHEMHEDIGDAPDPITDQDYEHFRELDGNVPHYLAACSIPLTINDFDQCNLV